MSQSRHPPLFRKTAEQGDFNPLVGGAAVGMSSLPLLQQARDRSLKATRRKVWGKSLLGGAAGAAAAVPILGAGVMKSRKRNRENRA